MPLNTFTPPVAPSPGSAVTPEIALNKASFGDGYTQASPKGLNNVRRSLSLKWEALTVEQAKQIEAFLVGQGGYLPFYFTHQVDGVQRKWTCETWSVTYSAPASVTATFLENFTTVS